MSIKIVPMLLRRLSKNILNQFNDDLSRARLNISRIYLLKISEMYSEKLKELRVIIGERTRRAGRHF